MERLLDKISFRYSDPLITSICNRKAEGCRAFTLNFNQNEDSFIQSDTAFIIPSFQIHHDVNLKKPASAYLSAMRDLIKQLVCHFPSIFEETKYYFDSSEILKPCFVQLMTENSNDYLYLFRLDLNIRLADSEIIEQASNDFTASFRTSKLFFESLIIPIKKPVLNEKGGDIPIKKMFSSTWVGETGTGYHLNGEWIDREVTKFLSQLLLPEGIRNYPYYPVTCDFNTICCSPPVITPPGRLHFLKYLDSCLPFLEPHAMQIESELKKDRFSKTSPLFTGLKKKVPDQWTKIWSSLTISPYLNENEMKEYLLEIELQQ